MIRCAISKNKFVVGLKIKNFIFYSTFFYYFILSKLHPTVCTIVVKKTITYHLEEHKTLTHLLFNQTSRHHLDNNPRAAVQNNKTRTRRRKKKQKIKEPQLLFLPDAKDGFDRINGIEKEYYAARDDDRINGKVFTEIAERDERIATFLVGRAGANLIVPARPYPLSLVLYFLQSTFCAPRDTLASRASTIYAISLPTRIKRKSPGSLKPHSPLAKLFYLWCSPC